MSQVVIDRMRRKLQREADLLGVQALMHEAQTFPLTQAQHVYGFRSAASRIHRRPREQPGEALACSRLLTRD